MVERAEIILLADEGQKNEQIAAALKTRTARVSKWRQRLAGLGNATRSGKPASGVSFTSPRRLRQAIDDFVAAYNATAAPFECKKGSRVRF